MADKINRLAPTGNMDKDSDVRYVGKGDRTGDTIDNRNTQIAGDEGASAGDSTPTLGNEFAFDLGEVKAQNKKYRVTVDGDATKSHQLKFLSTKRDYRMTTGTGSGGEVEFDGTVASLVANFNASSQPNAFTVNQNGNEVEFELTNGYNYYQWYLDSVGDDDVSVVSIQEAIPVDLAGPLNDIGSYDLLGDLFIFSTSQDNKPSVVDLSVVGIGPISAGQLVGPLTTITFNINHGLEAGQWIRITNSNAPWLNGLFVVNAVTSPVGITIITDTAWGASHPTFNFGEEVITIDPNGIGEIGVAVKDNDSDSWDYIRLLRSVELNFVSKMTVDVIGEKGTGRTALYFDDDYNSGRVFYYYGEYLLDGSLAMLNEEGRYELGYISTQTHGVGRKANVIINFKEQQNTGGDIPSGNLKYFCVLKDIFNSWSGPSDLTNQVITYNDRTNEAALGDGEDVVTTNKVNVLTVSGINPSVFSGIRLGYYIEQSGAASAILLSEMSVESDSIDLVHNGSGIEETYDIGLLASNFQNGYDFAKNIRIIDSILVRSNLRKPQINSDLSNWAKTFKHRIKTKQLTASTTLVNPEAFQLPKNGFNNVGYMMNETYRFSVRVRVKSTGQFTSWFWVDDIKIDPYADNSANAEDDRRDQSGTELMNSFDLTAPVSSSWPEERFILIPYVEFFGMNLNFKVEGTTVGDFIDRIEFGRADVISEVLCSGIATMSVKMTGITNLDYKTPASLQPFPAAAAGFPFGFVDGAPNTVQDPGYCIAHSNEEIDPLNSIHEYPFVYGPPVVGHSPSGHEQAAPWTSQVSIDMTPIFQYESQQNTLFGDDIVYINNPNAWGSFSYKPFKTERRFLSIYSPDIMMGLVSDIKGYDLLDFGEMSLPLGHYRVNDTGAIRGNMWSQMSKYFPEGFTTYDQHTIDEVINLSAGEIKEIIPEYSFVKQFGIAYRRFYSDEMKYIKGSHKNIASPVVYIENNGDGVMPSGRPDYGVRYIQIYRKLVDKYGNKKDTSYYTTNSIFHIPDIPTISGEVQKGTLNVFGGDTMTQPTYMKGRYIDHDALTDADFSSWSDFGFVNNSTAGFGGGLKFYSQNRVNSQMRSDSQDQVVFLGDGLNPISPWLEESGGFKDLMSYSSKYTPKFPAKLTQPPFEIEIDNITDFPQRMEYSGRKLYASKEDAYVKKLPLNIFDLDLTFGEIVHHENINGDLFTLQARKYQIQAFNARGQLESSINSVDVLLKSGDVFSQDGKTLSSYGTEHKWASVKGVSANGKDVLYWFNSENGLMMRFGADGTRVISSRGMSAYFVNYTKWVKDKYEHALEQGVRSVWDDRRKEAIWTFTGWRDIKQEWIGGAIDVGEIVKNENAPSDTYENFPRFFKCTVYHFADATNEAGVGADWEQYWEQISYTDFKYYSIFTVCFNEMTNGFRCFYGHLPKTYLKWGNTFLSSHPTERNLIFEHRKGLPTTWYGVDTFLTGTILPKIENAEFEIVMNELPEQSVRGVAVEYLSDNAPDRVEYRTKTQYTFDESAQFEDRDDHFFAPIRNDATSTGDPDSDDGMLTGDYLRVKFITFGGAYSLLHSIVVKIRDVIRRTNT